MARTSRIGVKLAAPVTLVSWPALCRPSTTGDAETGKVVGGRAKPGHDARGTTGPLAYYFNAHADKPGHDGMSYGRARSLPRSVHTVGTRPAVTERKTAAAAKSFSGLALPWYVWAPSRAAGCCLLVRGSADGLAVLRQ